MKEKAFSKIKNFFYKVGKGMWNVLYRYRYFFKRLGIALLTLFLSTIVIFFILRLIPGNIVREYALSLAQRRGISYDQAYPMAVSLLNYDPDAPLMQQFFKYIGGLLKGNLGSSMYIDGLTANKIIKQRLPWTLFITSIALIISFVLGTYMGAHMARKRKGITNGLSNAYIVISGSIPDYLMGLLLVVIFAFRWKIFPSQGNYDAGFSTPGFNIRFIADVIYHAILPIVSYVIVQTGSWALMMRGSAVGVLGEDYINAARARGISEKRIEKKYLKRNAMLPLITSLALTFGTLFGGSTLMETIFNYPGLGLELSARIGAKDYFVVQGIMFFSSAMIILVNFVADSIYSLVDPRVRSEK